MSISKVFALSLCLLSLACADAHAVSIGLNFVDGRNNSGADPLGAGQNAGVIGQMNWNNTDANSGNNGISGNTSNIASPIADTLVNQNGVASGATVSWTGHTTWSAGDGTTDNDKLMSDFLLTEANVGGQPGPDAVVTLSGLSYDQYDVYVYFAGSGGDNNSSQGTIRLNGTNDVAVTSLSFSGNTFDEATGGGDQGHYVLFSDVTGSSFNVSLDAQSGGNNFHMGIYGVQVVAIESVPEPTSILMAFIGLLTFGFVAWRRKTS